MLKSKILHFTVAGYEPVLTGILQHVREPSPQDLVWPKSSREVLDLVISPQPLRNQFTCRATCENFCAATRCNSSLPGLRSEAIFSNFALTSFSDLNYWFII